MKTYRVMFVTEASTTVDVQAASPEEAVALASEDVYVSLCHQCAHSVELGDFEPLITDGTPEVFEIGGAR